MALQDQRSGGFARALAVTLAIAMIATVGLFALPSARGAWTGAGLTVANSKYWGGHTFVPGETMVITMTATAADTINLVIQNGSGIPKRTWTGISIPTSGTYVLSWQIPMNWTDSNTYTVQGTDTNTGIVRTVPFAIQQYIFALFTDHAAYLVQDTVKVTWSAVYAQNYTPAPAGLGVLEVRDLAGTNLLSSAQVGFTSSQSSYSFAIPANLTTPDFVIVYAWFNDTAGLRFTRSTRTFGVGDLGVNVNVPVPGRGYFYPGEDVVVNIATPITGVGGGVYEPNVALSVNVTDQSTGLPVAGYGNPSLATDATGHLVYTFILAMSPQYGTYQVTVTGTAHGTQITSASAPPFNVQPAASFTVTMTLDKAFYVSGDTITATAHVVSNVPQTFTYAWAVLDGYGNVYAFLAGGQPTFSYTTGPTFQGTLYVEARVDNGTGGVRIAVQTVDVAYGYLAVNLNPAPFNPGDTIQASFSLTSRLITSPTYAWVVADANGVPVASGNTTSASASFTTPSPSASPSYTFTVTASQSGWSATSQATATQVSGYFLTLTPDRYSYNPGDTVTVAYTVTARGTSPMPSAFDFIVYIYGMPTKEVMTTSPTGTFTYTIPGNAPTGDQILEAFDLNTGASSAIVVHVGTVSPLLIPVAGIPLFDLLIFLLFVVLLLAVILLWRRTGMGRTPPAAEAGKPSTPPPPPPSGPSQQTAGPMSVACKHCGASIEITTSKRPIEVMCPSCGETQVVQ